ncbi:MAG: hypothetical protein KGI08_07525 [Thaumarchaeota archaeon]|nr:hypothetical protein [Nitrososphaerota archaeon]
MADPVPNQILASHNSRLTFEQFAYSAMIGTIVALAVIVLFGIVYPPPAPDIKVADWGAAIVSRAKDSVDVFLTLFGSLAGGTGITLFRGHMDARLGNHQD